MAVPKNDKRWGNSRRGGASQRGLATPGARCQGKAWVGLKIGSVEFRFQDASSNSLMGVNRKGTVTTSLRTRTIAAENLGVNIF